MEIRLPGEGAQPSAVPGQQAPTTPLRVSRDPALEATAPLGDERFAYGPSEVVGARWVPVHGTREAVDRHLRAWTVAAVVLAAVLTLLAVLLAVFASDAEDPSAPVSVLAIGGALIGGILLLGVGIGLVVAEA